MGTNFWDVIITAMFISYIILMLGGTVYVIQQYQWSPWWMLLSVMIAANTRIKTGNHKDKK